MIAINDRYNNKLFDIPVTKECVHEEELMKGDLVRLSWTDTEYHVLDVGTNIEPFPNIKGVDGLPARFMLFSEYVPERISGGYRYQPEFQHPKMWLGYVPYVFPTMDAAGAEITKTDGPYVGRLETLLNHITNFINDAFGFPAPQDGEPDTRFRCVPTGIDTSQTVSVTFKDMDVLTAIEEVAKVLECEWHLDWTSKNFYFGNIMLGVTPYELVVDMNVGLPSVTRGTGKFHNAFMVLGSSRNNTRQTEHGNMAVNTPLTLDEEEYPGSILDYRDDAEDEGEKVGPRLTEVMRIDDVYPRYELFLSEPVERRKYKKDENGDATKEEWSVWYVRLYRKWEEDGVVHTERFDLLKSEVMLKVLGTYGSGNDRYAIVDLPFRPEFFTDFVDDGEDVPYATLTLDGQEVTAVLANVPHNDEERLKTAIMTGRKFDHIGQTLVFTSGFNVKMLPEKYLRSLLVDGLVPTLAMTINDHAEACPSLLGTREFELNYIAKSITFDDKYDVLPPDVDQGGNPVFFDSQHRIAYKGYELPADYYEIIKKEEGDGVIIPTKSDYVSNPPAGIVPQAPYDITTQDGFKNNTATIFNIVMDAASRELAQVELLQAAQSRIAEMFADMNNYTFPSNSVHFAKPSSHANLYIGQRVRLKVFGDWSFRTLVKDLPTRIIKLSTKLDYPFEQDITVGNKAVKGYRAQMRDELDALQRDYENWVAGGYGETSSFEEGQDIIRDRGEWSPGAFYYYETFNREWDGGRIETSRVWHMGCCWECRRTLTTQEPFMGVSDWVFISGNSQLTLEFDSGGVTGARVGSVDLTVVPHVFFGYTDISDRILAADWVWTRESHADGTKTALDHGWDNDHASVRRTLHLTDSDMPPGWASGAPAFFRCTATVRDGVMVENYVQI